MTKANSNTRRTPAAVYLRRSDRGQSDESIPTQRAAVQKFADAEGYEIVAEFVDDGISGDATEKRRGFLAMRDAAGRGEFKAILCWDAARFGRFDSIEAGFWVFPIRRAGVFLHTIKDGLIDWRTVEGRIVYGVTQDGGRNAYLESLAKDIVRGTVKALESRWIGGTPAYGYSLDPTTKRLAPVPERVAVVRRIFEDFARRGLSIHSIAVRLNDAAVPSPGAVKGFGSKVWTPTTVTHLLRNEVYLGRTIWNRTNQSTKRKVVGGAAVKREGEGGGAAVNPRGEWIVCEGTHPAIIDEATFRLAQERLAKAPRRRTPAHSPACLFSGLVKCGRCGGPMCGSRYHREKTMSGETVHTTAYTCYAASNNGRSVCRYGRIFEADLCHMAAQSIAERIGALGGRREWRDEVRRRLREAVKVCPADLKAAEKQIAALDRRIDQGTERYLTAPASLTASLAAKLDSWRAERAEVAERVAALREAADQAKEVDAVADAVVARLEQIQLALIGGDDDARREVFQAVIEDVRVEFDEVERTNLRKKRKLEAAGQTYTPHIVSKVREVSFKLRADAFTVRNLVPALIRVDLATWDRTGAVSPSSVN